MAEMSILHAIDRDAKVGVRAVAGFEVAMRGLDNGQPVDCVGLFLAMVELDVT